MSRVTVSIVSHGHGALSERVVRQTLTYPEVARVVLTVNIPETLDLPTDTRLHFVRNSAPKGFGANHNAAFQYCKTDFFAVVNPDIEFLENPFTCLIDALRLSSAVVAGPLVRTRSGAIEDSIRPFPTVIGLMTRWISTAWSRNVARAADVRNGGVFTVDWIAGMFMLFDSRQFGNLRGFDEGFHLYCEDVDICVRAWREGGKVVAALGASVAHDARRDSRSKPRYLAWHVRSMLRYFGKHFGRLPESCAWKRIDEG